MSEHIIEIPDYTSPFDPVARAVSLGEEVVRCRDCKFYEPESMTREERGFGVYENVWEPGGVSAARAMGDERKRASIGACCRGKQPTAYGYKWRYA